jgi:hypothetical protein
MKPDEGGNGLVKAFLAFTIPSLVLIMAVWMGTSLPVDGALVRFANSMLTSMMVVSFMLLVTLIAYGDARKRPIAPLAGMLLVVGSTIWLTIFFLSQGDLLMEDNGSVRAQALSNIIRFGTTSVAIVFGSIFVGGVLLASLLNRPIQGVRFEEE